jgi:LysM repeat protein
VEHSERGSSRRRPTGFVVGGLIAILVVAAVLVVASVAGGGGDKGPARSRRTKPTVGTTTTTRGSIKYTVQAGDLMSTIAKKFGVSTNAIVTANQLPDADHLVVGQVLEIPPVTPVQLILSPSKVRAGGDIKITLKGAQPYELVTFEIHRPASVFVGTAHSALEDGSVETSYHLGAADTPGEYLVIAKGDQVTSAHAVLRVLAAPTTTTTARGH